LLRSGVTVYAEGASVRLEWPEDLRAWMAPNSVSADPPGTIRGLNTSDLVELTLGHASSRKA